MRETLSHAEMQEIVKTRQYSTSFIELRESIDKLVNNDSVIQKRNKRVLKILQKLESSLNGIEHQPEQVMLMRDLIIAARLAMGVEEN